jgi:hypothetical protein
MGFFSWTTYYLVKVCCLVFLPCEEGFPRISLVYFVHGYLLVILDKCMMQLMLSVYAS